MFETLATRIDSVFRGLRGRGRLTEETITSALRELRVALLEADVAVAVVKNFVNKVRERAVGKEVATSLTPDQALLKIVHDELVSVLGSESADLNLRSRPPAVVVLAGLQGAGKTTTAAKLAHYIETRRKKTVMLVSVDVYRPAAMRQLEVLARQHQLKCFVAKDRQRPEEILEAALQSAREQLLDVVIVDTAGRLHVDREMMDEAARLQELAQPVETLFVVDAMSGQDAAESAAAFSRQLALTGVVLTKLDGDARGGAALSVKTVTGVPIKFAGTGEKIGQLDEFHAERVVGRLLGKGDLGGLLEEVESKTDQQQAKKLARKLKQGRGFDFDDLAGQLEQILGMGGLGAMLEKLPGMGQRGAASTGSADDRSLRQQLAMIRAMTPAERRRPELLNGSRKRRIARGSGTSIQDLNRLVKQHTQMGKMMRKLSRPGAAKRLRGPGGGLPPGFKGF